MTPIDIQVTSSKVSVEGQAYSLYVGEGGGVGISVLHTYIFQHWFSLTVLGKTISSCSVQCSR